MYMDTGEWGYGGDNRGNRGRGRNNQRGYHNNSYSGRQNTGIADYRSGGGGRGSNWDSGSNQSSFQNRSNNYQRGRGGRNTWGRNQGGRGGRGPAAAIEPKDIEFLGVSSGGKDSVAAMVLDHSSHQVYTGSKDGTLRTWSCPNPQAPRPMWKCSNEVDMGGVIDSLLLEGGFLFVGMHARGPVPIQAPGLIKVCHMSTAASHNLEGHQGQILTLAAAGGMLFSGGQDASIRAWKFNQASNCFEAGVMIGVQQGGHKTAVSSLVPANQFLFSADFTGIIKVWDMASGACAQTLVNAHSSTITDMLYWENHLLSGSLDSTVKVWPVRETPAPEAVLETAPAYTHSPADLQGKGVAGGILKLTGSIDSAQSPVLLTSHNGEGSIRLWDLPSFADRGSLRAADPRALAAGFTNLLFSGDSQGNLKTWRWKATPMPVG